MLELRIAEIQERAGISDAELARRINTNQTQLSRLRKGDRKMSLEWLRRFAKALHCNVCDLLSDDDFPDRPSEDDMKILSELRARGVDPHEMFSLLVSLDKLVDRQATRRAARAKVPVDGANSSQLVDIWSGLSPDEQRHMLDMMRAAASLRGGQVAA